ncbi:MAG TPA: hypothetical protein DDW81_14540 [Cryomorphaceae bacterium]|nr:hypothetical protein [Cryomorphaceae bacterium]
MTHYGEKSTAKCWGIVLLCLFSTTIPGVGFGQALPKSYKGLGHYIENHKLDSLNVRELAVHFRTLDQNHSDSLLSYVFPRVEKQYKSRSAKEKAFLYNRLTAAAYQLTGNARESNRLANQQIKYYREAGNRFRELWAFTHKMFILADLDSINLAFEASIELQKKLDTYKLRPAEYANLYRQLCVFYQNIGELEHGLSFCNRAIEYSRQYGFKQGNAILYETLALLTESKTNDEEQAIALRRKAMKEALAEPDSFVLRIIYRNLARSFARAGLPDSAHKYFDRTFELYETHPYFFGWFTDQISYAEFLIEQHELQKAQAIIQAFDSNLTDDVPTLYNYYSLKELYAVSTHNIPDYLKWSTRYDSITEWENEETRLKAREEMATKYQTEKKETENKLLKAESQARLMQIVALSVLVLLLALIAILVVQRRKREKDLYVKDQRLRELELEREREEKAHITQRNDELKKDLGQRIKQVVEQQVINAELMEMVEELRTTNESPLVRKKAAQMKAHLIKSIQGQIFENIYTKMLELYPQLLQYLSEELGPDKEAELISTAMYFLGYESAVIAKVLNRSEKAIRNMRHRVRQKLGMENKDDFVEFLHRINKDLDKA